MLRQGTYVIMLRSGRRSSTISFNIGGEDEPTTLLRLVGRNAELIFKEIISALSRYGAINPIKISKYEEIFSIRDDLGPIIGGFLILIRRTNNPKKWLSVLNGVLEGKHPELVIAFESYLTMTIDISRINKFHSKKQKQALTPIVLDASSRALKEFVKVLLKNKKESIKMYR